MVAALRWRGFGASAAAVCVVLGGCALPAEPGAGPASPAGGEQLWAQLQGRTFLGDSFARAGQQVPVVAGTKLELSFGDGSLGAAAGCNRMFGDARLEADTLVLAASLASTQMACAPEVMAQETWWADFLAGSPTVAAQGRTVRLIGSKEVVELTDKKVVEPDQPLVGTSWILDSQTAGQAVSSVPRGVRAGIEFTEVGRALVRTGCNNGSAAVTASPTELEFGPLALTKKACRGAAAEVEAQFVELLSGTVAYTIDSSALQLTKGDSGLGFRARP